MLDHGLQTTRARQFKPSGNIAFQSYIPYFLTFPVMFLDQLGAALGLKFASLGDVRAVVYGTYGILLLEIEGVEFQLMNFDEHREPSAPQPGCREGRGSTLRGASLPG